MFSLYQIIKVGNNPEEVIADSACPFYIGVNAKKGTLSQHFVTRVVPRTSGNSQAQFDMAGCGLGSLRPHPVRLDYYSTMPHTNIGCSP